MDIRILKEALYGYDPKEDGHVHGVEGKGKFGTPDMLATTYHYSPLTSTTRCCLLLLTTTYSLPLLAATHYCVLLDNRLSFGLQGFPLPPKQPPVEACANFCDPGRCDLRSVTPRVLGVVFVLGVFSRVS